jgi:tRNA-dihydrouridine synthase
MLQQTACDGVALGRLAVAKPWIFAEWTDQFQSGTDIYVDTVKQIAELLATYYEPLVALQRFKRFSLYFAANFKFGHSYYRRISKTLTLQEARQQAIEFLSLHPEMSSTPNLNFFV